MSDNIDGRMNAKESFRKWPAIATLLILPLQSLKENGTFSRMMAHFRKELVTVVLYVEKSWNIIWMARLRKWILLLNF